ncbi:hypothetical protein P3T37_005778 [Kitasatospora sp. MAA4]|uniref:type VII secretion target n=1 Tax=Kitasatospora sp. MAA4 TaxID=3035093 RepID=UPI0024730A7E|nr:type VII secretion target [Kitasatospora sp. MAA4]MDH6136353.1 hypothetical protein [Kitasatospora sp. MAA4]
MGNASVGGGGPSAAGSAPSFSVDPNDLDAAANTAHDTGAAVAAEVKTIQQPSDAAVGGLLGWRTADSLSSCTAAWEDCLGALGSEVSGVGDKLSRTAANYRAGDGTAATAFPVPGAGRSSVAGN